MALGAVVECPGQLVGDKCAPLAPLAESGVAVRRTAPGSALGRLPAFITELRSAAGTHGSLCFPLGLLALAFPDIPLTRPPLLPAAFQGGLLAGVADRLKECLRGGTAEAVEDLAVRAVRAPINDLRSGPR